VGRFLKDDLRIGMRLHGLLTVVVGRWMKVEEMVPLGQHTLILK
jgi:hypothetical protein